MPGWFRNTGVITSVAFLQLDDTMKKLKPGFPDTQFHVVPVMYQSDPKTVTKTFDLKPEVLYCDWLLIIQLYTALW